MISTSKGRFIPATFLIAWLIHHMHVLFLKAWIFSLLQCFGFGVKRTFFLKVICEIYALHSNRRHIIISHRIDDSTTPCVLAMLVHRNRFVSQENCTVYQTIFFKQMQLKMCILHNLLVNFFLEIKRGWIYWQIFHPQLLFSA